MENLGEARSRKAAYDRWYSHTERGREVKRLSGIKARIKHRDKRLAQDKVTRMRRVYGVTPEMYAAMLAEQNSCCPICLRPQSTFRRGFAIDHDHRTGLTRSLLCIRCNGIVLRVVEEEWPSVIRALQYLRRWKVPSEREETTKS